jgi:hypothetical protein
MDDLRQLGEEIREAEGRLRAADIPAVPLARLDPAARMNVCH